MIKDALCKLRSTNINYLKGKKKRKIHLNVCIAAVIFKVHVSGMMCQQEKRYRQIHCCKIHMKQIGKHFIE